MTSRRLWCRCLGQGSGKNVHSSASVPGPSRCSKDQTASTPISRTLSAPASASRHRVSATPGRHTSKASTSYAGRAAASAAVASPTPEPISTISGASRPNQSASENPGSSTASSGITQRSWCAAQAAAWLGREPVAAPGVGEHLPHPATVLGQPVVRPGGPDALVHVPMVGASVGALAKTQRRPTFNERALTLGLTIASRCPGNVRAVGTTDTPTKEDTMARSHLLKALRPARVTGRHGRSRTAARTRAHTRTGTNTGTRTRTRTHG